MNNLCPCGSQRAKNECCISIISGKRDAETALELMRSRYTAFTMADGAYLMRSHHSQTRPVKERKSIEAWAKSVQWMGLVISGTQGGEAPDSAGYVEFRALYLEAGKMQEIHENSLFKREQGKWVYHSGNHR
ncbi:YchJ family protein [Mangrovibacterium marinum]|uniref:SEC-C motif-containing protein n=1 Tax=Mangrovibacterium marinum TaxID=1639118 RepID=A0A2T5C398_9BACT|nr:YchJ family metal-binding protein [Mangrovibacterium marinum]PTN09248.1 SEC-C motif-containing protein [Mangrovibacterium marinum]